MSASATAMPPWPEDPLPEIAAQASGRPVIVLDDDPTGTQTVRGVPVLTRWSEARLAALIGAGTQAPYLLTNSRGLPRSEAQALGRSIGRLLRAAAERAGSGISVVSRSDSTLRGHFPAEVDALAEGLGMPDARVLLAPYFGDGGRLTIDGVHVLRRDGRDVPVADTEYAQDPVFGYRSSDLRAWVAERCGDAPRPVAHVGLAAIRGSGPRSVRDGLMGLPPRGVLITDAVAERDIEVVALGALQAELEGLPLIARTAASYVRARASQPPAQLLADHELDRGAPGLVVVGSHVPTTSRQLEALLADPPVPVGAFELDVAALLADPHSGAGRAKSLAALAEACLEEGRTPVLHTSRRLERRGDERADLGIGALVSRTLVEAVRAVGRRPAWVLAKGGITSSDIATAALDVDEAVVLGQLLPGVPAWRCGPNARWPGLTYVVFPGNVGGPEALRSAVARLAGARVA